MAQTGSEAEVREHGDAHDREVFGRAAQIRLYVVTHRHPERSSGLQTERDLVVGLRPSPLEHREVDRIALQRFRPPDRHRLPALRPDETDLLLEVPHGDVPHTGIVEHDRDRLVLEDVTDERVTRGEVEPDPPERRGRREAIHAGGETERRHHRRHGEGESDDRAADGRRTPPVSGLERQPRPGDGRHGHAERRHGRGGTGVAVAAGELDRSQHRPRVPGGPPGRDADAGEHGHDDGDGARDEDRGVDERSWRRLEDPRVPQEG